MITFFSDVEKLVLKEPDNSPIRISCFVGSSEVFIPALTVYTYHVFKLASGVSEYF